MERVTVLEIHRDSEKVLNRALAELHLELLKRRVMRVEAMMGAAGCSHVAEHLKKVKPQSKGCEECLKMGDKWLHLRMCLECGHVGCCDSSKNRHARAHFHTTQHPLIQSAERGEDWKWCYIDEVYL